MDSFILPIQTQIYISVSTDQGFLHNTKKVTIKAAQKCGLKHVKFTCEEEQARDKQPHRTTMANLCVTLVIKMILVQLRYKRINM